MIVSEAILDANDDPKGRMLAFAVMETYEWIDKSIEFAVSREADQRLVKTTPKPSATKKSRGELVGPPPPPPPLGGDDVAAGGGLAVLDGIMEVDDEVAMFSAGLVLQMV